MQSVKGKVTLVTGGGRGLGEAVCRELGAAGAVIAMADIRAGLIEKVAADMRKTGCEVMPLVVDLTDECQIQSAVEQVAAKYGRLDVLINNAGVDKTDSIDNLTVADWDLVQSVNLRAPFVAAKYASALMKQNGEGHIVNIASTAAKRAWPNAALYNATKWGLLGLSHALHSELRPYGIKVTAVVAGGMRTPFLLDRFPDIPLENLQDPRNVAETIHYILTQPRETVISEVMVIPMRETSWP